MRGCVVRLGWLVVGVVWLAGSALAVGGGRDLRTSPHFAAPGSGEKVDAYEVSLLVGDGARQAFAVPGDCLSVLAQPLEGPLRWASGVDKALWWKVRNDCEYALFLQRSQPQAAFDYIGDFDFWNADLRELPIADWCQRLGRAGSNRCSIGQEGEPLAGASGAQCVIERGRFRGRIQQVEGELVCLRDPWGAGFRVLSVDLADVDGDGVQDAVLRLMALGRGMSRYPVLVAVTRLAPDGPFVALTPALDLGAVAGGGM